MGDLGLDDLQKRPPYRDPFSPAWMKLSHHHPEVVYRRMKNRYPGFRTWLKSFGTLFQLSLMRPNNFQKVHRILESSRSLFMKIFVSVTTRTTGLLQRGKNTQQYVHMLFKIEFDITHRGSSFVHQQDCCSHTDMHTSTAYVRYRWIFLSFNKSSLHNDPSTLANMHVINEILCKTCAYIA